MWERYPGIDVDEKTCGERYSMDIDMAALRRQMHIEWHIERELCKPATSQSACYDPEQAEARHGSSLA